MTLILDRKLVPQVLRLGEGSIETDPPAPSVFAKYLFASNLLDTISGDAAQLTRASAKTIVSAMGTPDSYAVDAPVFSGSALLLERDATDYVRYGTSFNLGGGNAWELASGTMTTGITDPFGGTAAVTVAASSSSDTPDLFNQTILSGGSGVGYFEFFAKSDTGWISFGVYGDRLATNGRKKFLDLTNHVVGSAVIYGSGIAFSDFEFLDCANGFTRVRFKCTNTITPAQSNLWMDFYAANSDGVHGTSTTGANFTVYELGFRDADVWSTIPSAGDSSVTISGDVLTVDSSDWDKDEYSAYLVVKVTQLTTDTETAYLVFAGDASPGATTNEISLRYASGVWTLVCKIAGTSITTSATLTAVKDTEYVCYWKITSAGCYLEVNGNSSSGSGVLPSYKPTQWKIGYNVASARFSQLKVLNSTTLTSAQAALI